MLMQIVIVVLLAGIGFYAYRAWASQNTSNESGTHSSSGPTSITQARQGAVLSLPPHGDTLGDLDVTVTARHLYRENGFDWHELECDSGHATVWVEIEQDDELEVSASIKRLRLDEIGLDAERLGGLASGTEVMHGDRRFYYTEKGEATFFADADTSRPEPFEYWDFEGDDERHDLGVERWGDDYRAYLSERLDTNRIKIYSAGDSA